MPRPVNISSSRAAAVVGLSKYKSCRDVWMEIMEEREPGFCERNNFEIKKEESNSHMKWGLAFEPAICLFAERVAGRIINYKDYFCSHEKLDFLTAHPDGLYKDTKKIHEAKTTSIYVFKNSFGEPGTDLIPPEYQLQCQHQLLVTGYNSVIMSILVFPSDVNEIEKNSKLDKTNTLFSNSNKNCYSTLYEITKSLFLLGFFHQYKIEADKELHDIMLEYYITFWLKNVIGREMPDAEYYSDIQKYIKNPAGTIVADGRIESLLNEYKDIQREIGKKGILEKRKDRIKAKVLDYALKKSKSAIIDDESKLKWLFYSESGKKLAQYDDKSFRVS